jgi:hypothetical protein
MLAAAAASVVLAGCASDQVELNGKIFDWMGVSASAQASSRTEPRLAPRTGIVLPPDANRLPEPGSGQEIDVAAGLNDPDRKKAADAAERLRLHNAYCSGDLNWKDRAVRKDGSEVNVSPYGPCSVFGAVLKQ